MSESRASRLARLQRLLQAEATEVVVTVADWAREGWEAGRRLEEERRQGRRRSVAPDPAAEPVEKEPEA